MYNLPMQIENLAISNIKPYENNARTHPKKQIELIADNIKRFGFTTPCLVDKDNNLIAGHGRIEAVKLLDWSEVPVVRMENLTEEEVKALRLADNKLAEMSEWDMGLVTDELKELDDDLLDLTGFDKDVLKEGDELYTSKIETPVYETSDEPPEIASLINTQKQNELLLEIEQAEIDPQTKEFLKIATYRHNIFDYSKIADFYAHASPEVQDLMEKSALVIIDFHKAIENGFVELTGKLKEQYEKDKNV